MKQEVTTTESVTVTTTVITCDHCGKEIGRSSSTHCDYKGHRCSICGRQFCYDCHKQVCLKDEDEMKHICPTCRLTDDGSLQKMKDYQKKYDTAIEAKLKVEEHWADRSINYKEE
jgi:hypothetical protein